MENFGNIKDTFKKIILESVIKKDNNGKKLFSTFLKNLKENKTLKNQFLIYKNLESKKFEDKLEAKEYIKENINLLKKINNEEIEKSNSYLLKLLKGKEIVKENNEFYKNIIYLSNVKKNPSNIDKINESMNKLINHMTTIKEEDSKIDVVDVPPSVLTKLMVNKFNEKYSDINESDKKLIKTVLNDKTNKTHTFNKIVRECIDSVDKKLNENVDLELKDKLLKVKDKLLNTKYQKDNFLNDIIKLYNLKETIDNE
jgi:hypothetical protein